MNDQSRTVVLSGVGPRIKITNKGKSKITVLGKAQPKTVKLKDNTNIKFAN